MQLREIVRPQREGFALLAAPPRTPPGTEASRGGDKSPRDATASRTRPPRRRGVFGGAFFATKKCRRCRARRRHKIASASERSAGLVFGIRRRNGGPPAQVRARPWTCQRRRRGRHREAAVGQAAAAPGGGPPRSRGAPRTARTRTSVTKKSRRRPRGAEDARARLQSTLSAQCGGTGSTPPTDAAADPAPWLSRWWNGAPDGARTRARDLLAAVPADRRKSWTTTLPTEVCRRATLKAPRYGARVLRARRTVTRDPRLRGARRRAAGRRVASQSSRHHRRSTTRVTARCGAPSMTRFSTRVASLSFSRHARPMNAQRLRAQSVSTVDESRRVSAKTSVGTCAAVSGMRQQSEATRFDGSRRPRTRRDGASLTSVCVTRSERRSNAGAARGTRGSSFFLGFPSRACSARADGGRFGLDGRFLGARPSFRRASESRSAVSTAPSDLENGHRSTGGVEPPSRAPPRDSDAPRAAPPARRRFVSFRDLSGHHARVFSMPPTCTFGTPRPRC